MFQRADQMVEGLKPYRKKNRTKIFGTCGSLRALVNISMLDEQLLLMISITSIEVFQYPRRHFQTVFHPLQTTHIMLNCEARYEIKKSRFTIVMIMMITHDVFQKYKYM